MQHPLLICTIGCIFALVIGCNEDSQSSTLPGSDSTVEAAEANERTDPDQGNQNRGNQSSIETNTVRGVQAGALRLTPEQISNLVSNAFGIQLVQVDEQGYTYDEIVDEYGVSLGGIDFIASARRDPSIKASTLLVVHAIAWSVSDMILWADIERPVNQRKLFTLCDPEEDRPFVDEDDVEPNERARVVASAQRWHRQLEEIYWRTFARPPVDEEVQILAALFTDAVNRSGWPGRGWHVVIYTLMSTVEFWTI